MLGQPVSMLIPRVVGFKLSGDLPEGATATDLVLTITEMLRKHGVVGKFVEFYGPGVSVAAAGQPRHHRQHEPGVRLDDRGLPDRRGDHRSTSSSPAAPTSSSRWSRPTPRSRASGTTRDAEPRFSEKLELDLATVVPSLAGPKRPQDRVSLSDAKAVLPRRARRLRRRRRDARGERVRRGASRSPSRPPTPRPTGTATATPARRLPLARAARTAAGRATRRTVTLADGTQFELDHGAVDDRRDHVVHQHLQPVGDDRRGPAGQEGRREGPAAQAVGQDHAGAGLEGGLGLLREVRPHAVPRQARLQPRRLRLHHLHRQLRPADPRGQPGRQRQRPRGRLGALGQPQLRGPDQPRHQDELPGVAAAGRRLRAGRLDGRRPVQRPAGPGHRRQRRLHEGHLAVARGGRGGHRRRRSPPRCSPTDYADVFAGDERWQVAADARGRHLRVGPGLDVRPQAAVLRRHARRARAGRPTSRARGCCSSSATRSPPTTSARPARSRRTRPPASTSPSTASSSATSTPTARAAATTR